MCPARSSQIQLWKDSGKKTIGKNVRGKDDLPDKYHTKAIRQRRTLLGPPLLGGTERVALKECVCMCVLVVLHSDCGTEIDGPLGSSNRSIVFSCMIMCRPYTKINSMSSEVSSPIQIPAVKNPAQSLA